MRSLHLFFVICQKIANFNQYRVGGAAPLPNHDREQNRKKLHDKLGEAQAARKAVAPEPAEGAAGSGGSRKKKVVKKPVPNFGGGKVGTK